MNKDEQLDPLVAWEFASHRQAVADAFAPPSVDTVFATARVRTVRRRTAAVTAVAAAMVGAALAGAALVSPSAAPPPGPPATPPTMSTAPAPPATTEPTVEWSEPGNQVDLLEEQTAERVRNATLTLPEWSGSNRQFCPTGEFAFTEGNAVIEEGTGQGDAWSYSLLGNGHGIAADVDGEGGDELLVEISCSGIEPQTSLLALAPDGHGFQTLGYVIPPSDPLRASVLLPEPEDTDSPQFAPLVGRNEVTQRPSLLLHRFYLQAPGSDLVCEDGVDRGSWKNADEHLPPLRARRAGLLSQPLHLG